MEPVVRWLSSVFLATEPHPCLFGASWEGFFRFYWIQQETHWLFHTLPVRGGKSHSRKLCHRGKNISVMAITTCDPPENTFLICPLFWNKPFPINYTNRFLRPSWHALNRNIAFLILFGHQSLDDFFFSPSFPCLSEFLRTHLRWHHCQFKWTGENAKHAILLYYGEHI